jgi:succinoglycan biosynthesis transport protein ExoP
MESRGYAGILRRWWWLLLAAAVIAGGIAYAASGLVTPTYRATTTLLVVQRQAADVVQLQDLQASERLANTFSRLVTVRPVLEAALARSGFEMSVEELEDRLTVSNPILTELLEISADADDPTVARDLANVVAETFISSNEPAGNRPGVVTIVERAEAPEEPVSPNRPLNAAVGALLGLIAVSGLVLLVEYLDDTVKSSDQAFELTGLPTLAHVQRFGRNGKRDGLPTATQPRSTAAEAYRGARTHLLYALGGTFSGQRILVTSPLPAEGKTTTAANLAIVIALAGARVVVVDSDLRRPSMHRLFTLPNSQGLTNLLLAGEPHLKAAIQRSVHANVSVVTSGPLPPNPSELLGSPRMREMLDGLQAKFDVILLDSPPVLRVTDAAVLASMATTSVIVVNAGKTRTDELRAAVQRLAQSGSPIAGVLLNRLANREAGYYGGYVTEDEPGEQRPGDRAGQEPASAGDTRP